MLHALRMVSLEDQGVGFERQWPVIKGQTIEMVKEREKSEISQGYFGLGAILERNNLITKKVNKNYNSYNINSP